MAARLLRVTDANVRKRTMSRNAKVYIGAVILAGAALATFGLANWHSEDAARFVAFLLLFAGAATLKFRVPGVTGTYTPVFFFALLGSATLSFSEVAIASALAGGVQCAFKPRHRISMVQICFNAANLVISTSSGFIFVRGMVSGLGGHALPASLILGAAVFYCVNTALVSGVLALIEGKSFWQIWQHWYFASLPYYLVGAAVVAALLGADNPVTSLIVILVAPPLLLATIYFRPSVPSRGMAELDGRGISYVE